MPSDKKTIGITPANTPVLSRLVRAGHFSSELDAAKFTMAYAIKRGVPAGSTEGAETKWNVGSLDPDNSTRALIEALYPEAEEPYRLVEHLMNEGLKLLATEAGGALDVYKILFTETPG